MATDTIELKIETFEYQNIHGATPLTALITKNKESNARMQK